jgi:lipopolysaccharide transport system permease protein
MATAATPRASSGEEGLVRVIKPAKRRVRFADLWRTWPVARILAIRDLKVKYKQSLLGPAWLIFQPLGILAGLLFVFKGVTNVDTGDVPYVVFALVGLTAWNLFQQTIANGNQVMIMNTNLVKRVAFPRIAFFSSTLLSNMVPPAAIFVATWVAMLVTGFGPPTQVLLLPLFILWLVAFTMGVLLGTASATARYRDIAALIPFWAQAGLFRTPVGYQVESAPSTIRTLLSLNPLTGIFESWRWSMLGTPVETLPIITAIAGTVLFAGAGWWIFGRMEVRFADYL